MDEKLLKIEEDGEEVESAPKQDTFNKPMTAVQESYENTRVLMFSSKTSEISEENNLLATHIEFDSTFDSQDRSMSEPGSEQETNPESGDLLGGNRQDNLPFDTYFSDERIRIPEDDDVRQRIFFR